MGSYTCEVKTCGLRMVARGYCARHYAAWKRHGDPTVRLRGWGDRKKHELYSTYLNMKDRCYNQNNKTYSYYGGKGVVVCDRWLGPDGFDNFLKDMGKRPKDFTLDRISSNGNYEPKNCRWASRHQQMLNSSVSNGFMGVSYDKARNKWRANITHKNITYRLGRFKTREEAIAARLAKQQELGVAL